MSMGWQLRLSGRRTIDVLLLIAIVATGARYWQQSRMVDDRVDRPAERLVVGSNLRLPEIESQSGQRVVVLFVRSTCPVCNAGMPFYRRLSHVLREFSDVQLIVVSRESMTTISEWLEAGSVTPDLVVGGTDLVEAGIAYVPTLVIADRGGQITDIVNRGLTPLEQEQAIDRLRGLSDTPLDVARYAPFVTTGGLADAVDGSQRFLVDVRSREAFAASHAKGAVNIPYDEMELRAQLEVPLNVPAVIDCRRGRLSWCDAASSVLMDRPGQRVFVWVRD